MHMGMVWRYLESRFMVLCVPSDSGRQFNRRGMDMNVSLPRVYAFGISKWFRSLVLLERNGRENGGGKYCYYPESRLSMHVLHAFSLASHCEVRGSEAELALCC